MFGKAQWAVVGIVPGSLELFQAALKVGDLVFKSSQIAQNARAKFGNVDSVGINPFGDPRKDEGRENGIATATQYLETIHTLLNSEQPDSVDRAAEMASAYYGSTEADFRLHTQLNWYGMWFVFNIKEDVSDMASIREQISYTTLSRPYKFTGKEEKKAVESTSKGWAELKRTQCPVLLDFETNRVYIRDSNQDNISVIRSVLSDFGLDTYALHWKFADHIDWITEFIQKMTGFGTDTLVSGHQFVEEINKRADEVRAFKGGELQVIDDPVLSKIVNTYFAVNDPGTGLQIAFAPGAALTLYPGGDPITVSNPSDVVNLMTLNPTAVISTTRVIFQEVNTVETTKGTKTFRNDLFSFDLNPNCNLYDAGAAQVRFDIPDFKRGIMKQIKNSRTEQPISFYWSEWLRQMNEGIHVFVDNIAAALGIDRSQANEFGLVPLGASGVTMEKISLAPPPQVFQSLIPTIVEPTEQELAAVAAFDPEDII